MAAKPVGRHKEKALSPALIRSLKEPGRYADGNGLYLKVEPTGAKRWVQRLVIHTKRRDIGLGSASLISLTEARELALANRKQARSGGDPLEARRRQAVLTFQEAAEKVYDLTKPTWRNPKHGKQWLATMKDYVFPHFGSKRLDLITSADVLAALTPIWTARPETARRVKQRIRTVLDWGIGQSWRTDNPADAISKSLPKHDRQRKHQRALPFDQVSGAIRRVWQSEASLSTKLAFEFLVLTASRSGEVRNALWSEVDLEGKVWTIPAHKMKAKRQHRVPLCGRALEILDQAKKLKHPDSDVVFPGTKAGKSLSDVTLSKLLKELGIAAVPHGFRSSFRMWAAEKTNFHHQVCEFAIAHVIGDKSEAAYNRTDLFELRTKLMDEWFRYLN